MPWFVLYTNPKAEKKVAEQLSKIGIINYCPLVSKMKQWSDRKKKIEVPLFSSYVFVNIDESKRNDVFQAKGAVRYLFWLGKPAIVRDEEIESIKSWLGKSIDIEVSDLKPGDKLVIEKGPFQNQEAVIQQIDKNKLRLVLESIGMVLTMQLKD